MNKADLANALAQRMRLSKRQGEDLVNHLIDVFIDELSKGEEVVLAGFGTFSVRYRSSRGGVNPQRPNEKIQVPETHVAKFKAGKRLKDALKNIKR